MPKSAPFVKLRRTPESRFVIDRVVYCPVTLPNTPVYFEPHAGELHHIQVVLIMVAFAYMISLPRVKMKI